MISVAIQDGFRVKVYGEKNQLLTTKFGILYGFTGTTFAVKEERSDKVYVYDEKGHQVHMYYTK